MPQCTFCKHFEDFKGLLGLCTAFPEGIPNEIVKNEVDHKLPMKAIMEYDGNSQKKRCEVWARLISAMVKSWSLRLGQRNEFLC